MIRKHRHGIIHRNNHERVKETARRFGIWLATMALVIACIAGAGILLAPAKADSSLGTAQTTRPADRAYDKGQ